jgi:hypothetical protein
MLPTVRVVREIKRAVRLPQRPQVSLPSKELGFIAFRYAVSHPFLYLVLNPSDSTRAKLYPLGKPPGLFEAGDMSR